ncbi:MAG: glycosyltransferase [Desulfomonile tiedjei]|nr:glycosyltransferase [Desulfomonile tiedjei]
MIDGIHIAVEATGAKFGGSETILLEFLDAAIADRRVAQTSIFCSPRRNRGFEFPSSAKVNLIENEWCDKNYLARVAWYEFGLGIAAKRLSSHVIFASSQFGRGCFGVPHVTYVQQSLPFSDEAVSTYRSALWRFRIGMIRHQMKRSCTSARRVLVQCAVMKDWICSSFNIEPSKVTVVYSGPKHMANPDTPSPKLASMRLTGLGPKLLYVGADYPYKKLDTAVAGLALLRELSPEARLFLTLPEKHHYAARPGVHCLGYLRGAELTEAYQLADALILPSLVESMGQTPLEAMSVGTPALVADRPYAHDICQDAALFFDPWSPDDFAKKASLILADRSLHQSLVEKGFALVMERKAAKPYEQILDIVLESANAAK